MPKILCNNRQITVAEGTTLAAALLGAGIAQFRASTTGAPRGPICGMGVCMECRVTVDGERHILACQTLCREGMEVETT
jgi:predicted molibdopterin-dependent oxidoreductase YjgC